MKKLLSIPVMLVLAGFILSSCSTMSITKRRYTKGYFVEHRSHRHSATRAIENPKVTVQSHEKGAVAVNVMESVPRIKALKANTTENPGAIITANAAKPAVANSKEVSNNTINLAVRHPVKALRQASKLIESGATGNDALSLLWVVIVVILILYLLGILFDGFGLGSLIHLLAVIAIVLLILWLLRII